MCRVFVRLVTHLNALGRVGLTNTPVPRPANVRLGISMSKSVDRAPVLERLCHAVSRSGTLLVVAEHYTLRLAAGMRERLSERARRSRIPERTLAQRYVEEGLRHDTHPLIQFLDGQSGRRASLIGSGLDVWEVIATVRDNDGSLAEAAAYLEIPAGLVEAAVSYYGDYREEIDDEIRLNEAEYERGLAAAASGERALRA